MSVLLSGNCPELLQCLCFQLFDSVVGLFHHATWIDWASLMAQTIKNLPAMRETWVQSVGWEDPLEEGMATHSSILGLENPWTEESGRLHSPWGRRVGHDWVTKHNTWMDYMNVIQLLPCSGMGGYTIPRGKCLSHCLLSSSLPTGQKLQKLVSL